MSKIDDIVFTVKGKTVSTPSLKGLPKDVSAEALKRFKILGSAVAGFTKAAAKTPPTVAAMGGAGGPARSRSPSPKPAPKPKKKEPKQSAKEARAEMRLLQMPGEIVDQYLKAAGRDEDEDTGEVIEELGYDEVVSEVVRRMKKEKFTAKQILVAMKTATEGEGYSMYDDYIEEHS
tara:strand:- start:332 stop:859 length:528 start_codon:yes stop_codon:yes gene_type:complete